MPPMGFSPGKFNVANPGKKQREHVLDWGFQKKRYEEGKDGSRTVKRDADPYRIQARAQEEKKDPYQKPEDFV